MTFFRWDPFQRFGISYWTDLNDASAECTWKPVVDIYHGDEGIVIIAEVPGVNREDIDIEIQHDRISFSGRRNMGADMARDRPLRRERCYGSFFRAFSLPGQVDPGGITASLQDGILEIRLPEVDVHRIRQIPIDREDG
jgi:HSP20 family protein